MAARNHHIEIVKQLMADHGMGDIQMPELHTIPQRLGLDMNNVGVEMQVELGLYVGLSTMFALFCLAVKTEKTRAWFLTALSSGLCTAAGVYVCWKLHWDFSDLDLLLQETNFTRLCVIWFRAANVLDIVLGIVFYRSQLHFLTTWVHHFAYVVLCFWMLANHTSILFGVFLLEELPTFVMSLGRLNSDLRNDILFGVTYFLLRIGLHTLLAWVVFTWPQDHPKLMVVKVNVGFTWLIHMHWFFEWLKQQRRGYQERKASKLQD